MCPVQTVTHVPGRSCRFIRTSVRTEVRSISIALVPTTSGGLARSHHQVTMNLFGSKRQDPPFSLLSRTRSRENRNTRPQSFSYGRLQKRALAAIFPGSYARGSRLKTRLKELSDPYPTADATSQNDVLFDRIMPPALYIRHWVRYSRGVWPKTILNFKAKADLDMHQGKRR